MNTQKVAITVPKDLIMIVDDISKERGISRSKFISAIIKEKILSERNSRIKAAYDTVFSDESIRQEQQETAKWFDVAGAEKGQEW